MRHQLRFTARLLALAVVAATGLVPVALSAAEPVQYASEDPVELDVLFVGAHPDDEAFTIPAFGQWEEYDDVKVGVMTVTRGEGGGNAVGLEEGPELGLLREAEERRAVALGNIHDIFYEDKVDFYYNVSAPLTEAAWGHDDALARVVRIVRQTRPKVITTMNPSPTPGNHGHHQYAARLAVEAYYAAADPAAYPEHMDEGLGTWRTGRLYLGGAGVVTPGAAVEAEGLHTPLDGNCMGGSQTQEVYSVSGSRFSQRHGKAWGLVLGDVAREYPSQGWSSPAFVALLTALGGALCNNFIQVDSRVPFTPGSTGPTAALEGAVFPAAGGLPLGTEFHLTVEPFHIVAGTTATVTAHVRRPGGGPLGEGAVTLTLPSGWTHAGDGALQASDGESTATFEVTVPADAPLGQIRIGAKVTAGEATGETRRLVEVAPAVRGRMRPLPHVVDFRDWAREVGVPQLDTLLTGRQAIRVGATRRLPIDLESFSAVPQSGTVSISPADGFSVSPAEQSYADLPPGGTLTRHVDVVNTDPSLATSDDGGDYPFVVDTTSRRGTARDDAALNLVPGTVVPLAATPPAVDGVESEGEYAGETLDVSRVWEGTAAATSADASGTAKVTWHEDALYVIVHVRDQAKGAVLPPEDCRRHWRTDSVEITIDPKGNSENTSTTFKAGIFPETDDPANGNPPCWQRDADNRQGPGPLTAPGMQVAAVVSSPYQGYTLESKIAFADLPAEPDPTNTGLNILIYDSDTQDRTGQRRLGWSTWGGVQGDPYRWGRVTLDGYKPPGTMKPVEPNLQFPPLRSVDSPQSILQAAHNGVALAGLRQAAPSTTARITPGPNLHEGAIDVVLQATGPGTAHLFAWDGDSSVYSTTLRYDSAGTRRWHLPLSADQAAALDGDDFLLVGFDADRGGTKSIARQLTLGPLAGPWPGPAGACDPGFVPAAGFDDIARTVHRDNIGCVAWYLLTRGKGDVDGDGRPEYVPSESVSRAQMASFIARLATEGGVALPRDARNAFEDDDGGIHEDNINALAAAGLVEGKGDRDRDGRPEYDPAGDVTRAQMASFIARVHAKATGRDLEAGPNAFEDDDGGIHESNINALAAAGLVAGKGDRDNDGRPEYDPAGDVTRAQMASFIANDLRLLVEADAAHRGGAEVVLDSFSTTSGGSLSGAVRSNKRLLRLTAGGCGLDGKRLEVGAEARFSVTIPAAAGSCDLTLTAVTTNRDGGPDRQRITYTFTVDVRA